MRTKNYVKYISETHHFFQWIRSCELLKHIAQNEDDRKIMKYKLNVSKQVMNFLIYLVRSILYELLFLWMDR